MMIQPSTALIYVDAAYKPRKGAFYCAVIQYGHRELKAAGRMETLKPGCLMGSDAEVLGWAHAIAACRQAFPRVVKVDLVTDSAYRMAQFQAFVRGARLPHRETLTQQTIELFNLVELLLGPMVLQLRYLSGEHPESPIAYCDRVAHCMMMGGVSFPGDRGVDYYDQPREGKGKR